MVKMVLGVDALSPSMDEEYNSQDNVNVSLVTAIAKESILDLPKIKPQWDE